MMSPLLQTLNCNSLPWRRQRVAAQHTAVRLAGEQQRDGHQVGLVLQEGQLCQQAADGGGAAAGPHLLAGHRRAALVLLLDPGLYLHQVLFVFDISLYASDKRSHMSCRR